jgi:hypothetical protein
MISLAFILSKIKINAAEDERELRYGQEALPMVGVRDEDRSTQNPLFRAKTEQNQELISWN